MFLRTKFVTNSSSTSFIFYGIEFRTKDVERESFSGGESLQDLAYRLDCDKESTAGLHHCWEVERAMVYAKESYIGLDESGVEALPVQILLKLFSRDKNKEWNQAIKELCDNQGLPYHTPSWQIAIHVER
jgi:hypothetical protein